MKTIQIVQLVFLVIFTIALIGVLFAFVTGHFSFGMRLNQQIEPSTEIYDLIYEDEPISDVYIDINVASIRFETSETDEVRVVYDGPESEMDDPKVTTSFQNGRLEIHEARPKRILFTNYLTENKSLTVYLPADFDGMLECTVVSGGISANRDFDLANIYLKSTSGNINIQEIQASSIYIKGTSGNMSAGRLEADSVDVLLVSGSIRIQHFDGQGEIKSTSGVISVDNYSGGGEVTSVSGSVRLGLIDMTDNLSIATTSGSVDVTVINPDLSAYCDFSTTTGSINTYFAQSEQHVVSSSLNTTMGENPEYQFNIKVTSGSIGVSGPA